jgi:predicted AAA+ superfamily ATPase
VSLDNPADAALAQGEPEQFLNLYKPPVLIDEVQYAPELFRYIKIAVDNSEERGLFWLTGSQQYNLMAGITESLAGRVCILDMGGFSIYERDGCGARQAPFIPSAAPPVCLKVRNAEETYKIIWQGAYPDVVFMDPEERNFFYGSYLRTYIERDIRQLINVGNEAAFMRFLSCAAARTGQELNLADLSRDCGISANTAGKWLSMLETSGLVYILQPYFRNISKRLTKRPKMYFTDTGLCAYLTKWETPAALEQGPLAGAFFETFVVGEILKSWIHNGKRPDFFYYRDSNQTEIDLLISQNGFFYPIEIKKSTNPVKQDIKAFDTFAKYEKIAYGALICLTDHARPLTKNTGALSVWEI